MALLRWVDAAVGPALQAISNVAQVMNVKATTHVPVLVVYHCQLLGWGVPVMEYDGPTQRMLVSWDDIINACLTPQAVDAAVLRAAAAVADVLSASQFKQAVDARSKGVER